MTELIERLFLGIGAFVVVGGFIAMLSFFIHLIIEWAVDEIDYITKGRKRRNAYYSRREAYAERALAQPRYYRTRNAAGRGYVRGYRR